MRQTRCVRRACTGHVRRHLFFFYPYRPALRRLLLSLSSCRGRSRSKKRRRGARAREVRERARSRVTILTVSRSCIGGATRENVVGGAGPGPSELSVCLSDKKTRKRKPISRLARCRHRPWTPVPPRVPAPPRRHGAELAHRPCVRRVRADRPTALPPSPIMVRDGTTSAFACRQCTVPLPSPQHELFFSGTLPHML